MRNRILAVVVMIAALYGLAQAIPPMYLQSAPSSGGGAVDAGPARASVINDGAFGNNFNSVTPSGTPALGTIVSSGRGGGYVTWIGTLVPNTSYNLVLVPGVIVNSTGAGGAPIYTPPTCTLESGPWSVTATDAGTVNGPGTAVNCYWSALVTGTDPGAASTINYGILAVPE